MRCVVAWCVMLACASACVDRVTDPNAVCEEGVCRCIEGFEKCGSDECATVLATDRRHCGGCGIDCGDAACADGLCQCAPALADCDATSAGCETDIGSDPANCGACGRDCLGGACIGGACQPLALATQQQPIVSGTLRLQGDRLFYTADLEGSVALRSVSTAGGVPVELWTGDAVYALSTDDEAIYWTGATLGLNRMPLGGGSVDVLGAGGFAGLDTRSVVSDDAVFITRAMSCGAAVGDGAVSRVAKADGATTAWAPGESCPIGIALGETHMYWTSDVGIRVKPIAGGAATTLVSGIPAASALALDGDHVYWTDDAGGTVNRAPLDNGSATELASGIARVGRVIVADGYAYTTSLSAGTVVRVAVESGEVEVLASSQNAPAHIALDDNAIYWLTRDAVMKLAR